MNPMKLKPCPFCGCEPDVGRGDFRSAVTNYRIQSDGLLLAVISCTGCNAEMAVPAIGKDGEDFVFAHRDGDNWVFFDHDVDAVTKAAIAAWNKRAEKETK